MTNTKNLADVPIGRIIPTEFNPRTVNEKSPGYIALVESITAQGVVVPVHCREHPAKRNHFELLAGERRYRAAKGIGLKVIPAIHHGKLSDEAAFDITFCENFAREDLTPLEEGKAVATLMFKYAGDTKAVASKMGKSTRWVLQRQAVYQNLTADWKKAVIENPGYTDWTTSHLQLIAVFPSSTQKELLGHFQDSRDENDGLISIKDLRKELDEWLRLLSGATFDLGAGKSPCSKCAKRSSFQPGLFDDTMDKATAQKNDRCLDKSCWDEKTAGAVKITIKKLEDEHGKISLITSKQTTWDEDNQLAKLYPHNDRVREPRHFKLSKKGAKGAVPAVVVLGSDVGELRWIITNEYSSGSSSRKTTAGPTPLKDRRKHLNSKRWFEVLRELTKLVAKSTVDMIVAKDKTLFIMTAAATFGTKDVQSWNANWKTVLVINNHLLRGPTHVDLMAKAQESLWRRITPVLADRVTYNGPITQVSDKAIKEAKTIAKHLGIDIKAMYDKQVKAITEPKSWAKLNADGTPKTAAKKTEKKKSNMKKTEKTNPKPVE